MPRRKPSASRERESLCRLGQEFKVFQGRAGPGRKRHFVILAEPLGFTAGPNQLSSRKPEEPCPHAARSAADAATTPAHAPVCPGGGRQSGSGRPGRAVGRARRDDRRCHRRPRRDQHSHRPAGLARPREERHRHPRPFPPVRSPRSRIRRPRMHSGWWRHKIPPRRRSARAVRTGWWAPSADGHYGARSGYSGLTSAA